MRDAIRFEIQISDWCKELQQLCESSPLWWRGTHLNKGPLQWLCIAGFDSCNKNALYQAPKLFHPISDSPWKLGQPYSRREWTKTFPVQGSDMNLFLSGEDVCCHFKDCHLLLGPQWCTQVSPPVTISVRKSILSLHLAKKSCRRLNKFIMCL